MIPKIIHYCWFGGEPLPEPAVKCIESWKKYCPDYEIREWNEGNLDIAGVDYMREAYEEKMWSFVSDVARLQVVLGHGGIYFDTDVEVCRSFDPLLCNRAFAGMEEVGLVNLGLGFGAEKHDPLIQRIMDEYKIRHFRRPDGTLDRTPCSQIQTEVLRREGLRHTGEKQCLNGLTVYPKEYFSPISYKTGLCEMTENTFSIHHYAATWKTEDERRIQNIRWDMYRRFGLRLGGALYKSAFLIPWLKVRLRQYGFIGALKRLGRKLLGRS